MLSSHKRAQDFLTSHQAELLSHVGSRADAVAKRADSVATRVAALKKKNSAARRKALGLLRSTVGALSPSMGVAEKAYGADLRRLVNQTHEWKLQLQSLESKADKQPRLSAYPAKQGDGGEVLPDEDWATVQNVLVETRQVLCEAREAACTIKGRLHARISLPSFPDAAPFRLFDTTESQTSNAPTALSQAGPGQSPLIDSPLRWTNPRSFVPLSFSSPSSSTPKPAMPAPPAQVMSMGSLMSVLGDIDVASPLQRNRQRRRRGR